MVTARRRLLGEEHPDTLTAMNNLAQTLYVQGDLARARTLQEQVLAGFSLSGRVKLSYAREAIFRYPHNCGFRRSITGFSQTPAPHHARQIGGMLIEARLSNSRERRMQWQSYISSA